MALLHSEKISLGSPANDFKLASVDGKKYSLHEFSSSQVLVILFICNHCPYVQAIEDRMITLHRFFQTQSVQFVGICSNDSTDYPDDSPASLLKRWKEKQYGFPYLIDETQQVAKDYGAVCTPDIYVYDRERKLAYHGRLDDNWKDAGQVKTQDLKEAIQKLLIGQKPHANQISSMGCSIKWKKSS